MKETIEKKVAETILEKPTDEITIAGKAYPIAPPTTGTLIMVSELVSTFPAVDKNAKNALYEVLRTAKDLSVIGRIAATLALGAKRIKEGRWIPKEITEHYMGWSWRKFGKVEKTRTVTAWVPEIDYLAEKILDEMTVESLNNIIVKRLGNSQFGDFFVLTTSLSEVNLLKRTREVETASGD